MKQLLKKFIQSFHKAIEAEMDAMRKRMGPFEVPVSNGRAVAVGEEEEGFACRFDVAVPNEKLVLHAECTLRHEGGEDLVTITGIDKETVTVSCDHAIRLDLRSYSLVIYPWFLYERLMGALEALLEREDDSLALAMALFGKGESSMEAVALEEQHAELNESQRRAVQLCCDSSLAFVWGPPGTGKTTTLGHIVTELLRHGHRILITSTTNAAVDQALAKLAALDEGKEALARGTIVRVGQIQGETYGASLGEVVARLNAEAEQARDALASRRVAARARAKQCDTILEKLAVDAEPQQTDLFGETEASCLLPRDLMPVFSERNAKRILTLPVMARQEVVRRRQRRLSRVAELCRERIAKYSGQLHSRKALAVRNARVVLATMTNMYISKLLNRERFDVVIVEEAGMAILPTLFYCATLADDKIIIVGDPKQLPPIVQSRSKIVHRAMGRSIFEVTVPAPHASDVVVMLDTQYRMHPTIGDLVSTLFYEGKLRNGENTGERETIAARRPYPGAPIVVVDTEGQTTCATRDGSYSRFNETTARYCVELAQEALRDGLESVAIITPYVEQSRLVRRLLSEERVSSGRVECRTVHRFQGNERDLVIVDTVDTAPMPPGVLLSGNRPQSSARNLLNVSISRARGKLILVADVAYFAREACGSVLNELLGTATAKGARHSCGHP